MLRKGQICLLVDMKIILFKFLVTPYYQMQNADPFKLYAGKWHKNSHYRAKKANKYCKESYKPSQLVTLKSLLQQIFLFDFWDCEKPRPTILDEILEKSGEIK